MPSSETAPLVLAAGATASSTGAPITPSLPDETRPLSSAPTEPALASPAPNASSSATPEPSIRSPSTASTRTTESRSHHALGTPSRTGSRTTSSAALRITSLSAEALLPFGASPTDRGRGNGLGNGHGAGSPTVGTPIQSVFGKPFAALNLPPSHSPGAGVSYSGMARNTHSQHSPIPRIDEMGPAAIAQTPLFGESVGAGAMVFNDAAIPVAVTGSESVNGTNAVRIQKPPTQPVRNLAASRHPPRPHPPPPPPPVPKAALVPRTSTFASPPKALRHATSSAAATHATADDQQPMPFVTTRALGRHALGAARGRRTLNGAPKRVAPPKLAPLADGVLLDGFFLVR